MVLTPCTVIGDRLVTPSSFVYLIVKVRLTPPVSSTPIPKVDEDAANNDQRDNEFLNSRKDVEDLIDEQGSGRWVHAPHWPSVCFKFSFATRILSYGSRTASRLGGRYSQTQRPIGLWCPRCGLPMFLMQTSLTPTLIDPINFNSKPRPTFKLFLGSYI